MVTYNNQLSKEYDYIDYLKAIAAYFVVLGHCISYLRDYITYMPPIGDWIGILVSSVHVPLFFVIAGYLCHRQPYKKYVYKKIMRIIIPYFTFAVLKLVFTFFIDRNFMHGANYIEVLYDSFIIGGLYWFIYCMFLIYLIAPFAWKKEEESLKSFNIKILITIFILVIINFINIDLKLSIFPQEIKLGDLSLKTPFFQIENVIIYFPYFCFGRLIKENNDTFKMIMSKNKKLFGIISIILIAVFGYLVFKRTLLKGFIVKLLLALALMFFLYNICLILPDKIKALKTAGKYSLQIMLFDSFYKVILFTILLRFFKADLTLAIVISVIDITLACVSCYVLRKIPYINKLFGL